MVQEATQTATPAEALPTLGQEPVEGVEPEAVSEAPEGDVTDVVTEGETTEEEPVPAGFDPARYENDEAYKTHVDTVTRTAQREARMQLLDQIDQQESRTSQILQHIDAGIHGFNKMFRESGMDADALEEALQRWAPQLGAFKQFNADRQNATRFEGATQAIAGLMRTLSKEIGDAEFGESMAARYGKELRYDGGVEAIRDWMSDIQKRVRDKYEAPLKKEIANLKAQLEGGKVAARKNGPDTAPKGSSAGNRAYSALTPDERRELAKQGAKAVDAHIAKFGA